MSYFFSAMNQLSLHLLYLVRHHDCVIVPGFGAFIIEAVPAMIDGRTMTVFAPMRKIFFNGELTDDDGLLIHSLSRRGGISHQEARRIIDHWVQSAREQLALGESVAIEGIGTLVLSEEGCKIFSPAVTRQRHSVRISMPEESEKAVAASPEPEAALPYSGTQSAAEGVTEDVRCEDEGRMSRERFDTRRNYYLPINKWVARVACVLAVMICAVTGIALKDEIALRPTQQASVVPVETLMNISSRGDKAHETIAETQSSAATSEGDAEESEQTTPAVIKETPDELLPYHLIVGSFSSREEAERYVASLERKGSKGLTPIKGHGKMWRVSAESGSDRALLQSHLNEIASEYPGAWIWEKK